MYNEYTEGSPNGKIVFLFTVRSVIIHNKCLLALHYSLATTSTNLTVHANMGFFGLHLSIKSFYLIHIQYEIKLMVCLRLLSSFSADESCILHLLH